MRWSLTAASLAALSTGVDAISAGAMEVNLLFPRDNETYAPNANMPVIFSIRNAAYGQYLEPFINALLYNTTVVPDDSITAGMYVVQPNLDFVNWAAVPEPYFAYSFNTAFRYEANWTLSWRLGVTSCKADGDGVQRGHTVRYVSDTVSINITTKRGAKMPDLVAATAGGKACNSTGAIIAVTDKAFNVTEPPPAAPTCAVLDLEATPTIDPCKATIDAAAAASITAAQREYQCNGNDAPADCPPRPSPTYTRNSAAAQRPAGAGTACFVAGALGAVFAGLLWA